MKKVRKQRGFLLIGAAILVVVGGMLAATSAHLVLVNSRSTINQLNTTKALYIADAGLQRALHELISPNASLNMSCGRITGDSNFTDVAYGDGEFTVTGTTYISSPTTTLSSSMSASDTIIPLEVTSYTYAPAGQVNIESEKINYYGLGSDTTTCAGASRCLLNAKRGVDGTTAASHSSGEGVEQNQCYVSSAGVIYDASGSDSIASRTTAKAVTDIGAGFAVGAVSVHGLQNNAPTFLGWNNVPKFWRLCPKPLYCSGANPAPETQWNKVSVVNADYAWAVGNSLSDGEPMLAYWDGSRWIRDVNLFANNLPDVNYFDVQCLAANNCIAVGGGGTVLAWNGTVWNEISPSGNLSSLYFMGVHCINSNECWVVGTDGDLGGIAPTVGSNPTPASYTPIYHYINGNWEPCDRSGGGPPLQCTVDSAVNEHMFDVLCLDSNTCYAVGTNEKILSWNSSTSNWGDEGYGLPSVNIPFYSIFCSTANNCWAIGSGEDSTGQILFVQYNGTNWTRYGSQPSNVQSYSDFFDITCLATNNCWAVGERSGGWATYLKWDGSTWTRQGTPIWSDNDAVAESGLPDANLFGIGYVGGVGPPTSVLWHEVAQ